MFFRKKEEEKMSYKELEKEWEEQNRTIDMQTAKINRYIKRTKKLEKENAMLMMMLAQANLKLKGSDNVEPKDDKKY